MRLVENQVRFTVPPCYPSWTEVLEEQWTWLHRIIKSYFDLQGDRSLDDYQVVRATIDRLATARYRDYKFRAHNHLKAYGPSRPYGNMSAEYWQKCIDFFTSHTFISSKNKTNRDKAKCPSVQGSKSFFATRYDKLRRMQREIELLKNSISVAVPVEDENENENEDEEEGLGDL
ncbi:hypothetical protein Adt_35557 [Abeliophyllum distichum]|uniref:Transposase n=1 Tax=Abeliophyllum distichum TaxID=126358 RepID=A0ABD1QJ27_9LAMI